MTSRTAVVVFGCLISTAVGTATAQDWPQWRGINRDAGVVGFNPPSTWPEELTQKWRVAVGDGVATPALVGDNLYVFSRVGSDEVIRCLDAATGQEVWQSKYAADDADGPAARFPVLGPRSSPTVADGKVVTLGTRGTLTCYDAKTGKQLWQKDDFHSWPRFYVSSSPIVFDNACIAVLGGEHGAIVAYDLTTGTERWKWTGDGPAYGSPVLATVGGTNALITPTAGKLVAVDVSNGELLWELGQYSQGRYNAASPIVEGETLIYAGPTRGITAERLVQQDGMLAAKELWSNADNSVLYNTPVVIDDLLFGLSTLNSLFCVNVHTGQTAWNAPIGDNSEPQRSDSGADRNRRGSQGQDQSERERQDARGRSGRRGGGGSSAGYGSIVGAGNVLMALTPNAELIVFQASDQSYNELARYKVANGPTYSYPVVSGNRIYIKDKDSVTLWTVD